MLKRYDDTIFERKSYKEGIAKMAIQLRNIYPKLEFTDTDLENIVAKMIKRDGEKEPKEIFNFKDFLEALKSTGNFGEVFDIKEVFKLNTIDFKNLCQGFSYCYAYMYDKYYYQAEHVSDFDSNKRTGMFPTKPVIR